MEQITSLVLLLGGWQVVLTVLIAFAGKQWLSYLNIKQRGEIDRDIEQIRANLQSTNLRLQAALDTEVHVNKVQFENELRIYRAIWDVLIEVRKTTAVLRPVVGFSVPNESEDEGKRRRLREFDDTFQKFLDQVNKERPFYPEEIYLKLQVLSATVREEAIDYESGEYGEVLDVRGYYERARENSKAINQCIDDICEAIRQRIAKVSIA